MPTYPTHKTPDIAARFGGFHREECVSLRYKFTKSKGASEEKIRRCFNAITLYNDTIATGDDDRLAVTNQALRELSGVNGMLVKDWLKAHGDEVISHNSKYGMQNPKDPGNPTTYYNKNHGSEKITKILSLINEQCLDGEALKSQQTK